MQKIIIFEGPDRTGKTNIAQALAEGLGIPYFKNEAEVKNFLNPKEYYVNTLRYADPYFLSYLKQTKSSVIIDRHYPSEWVYSKVFKRKTDQEALRRTDEAMAALGAKIVITWRESYLDREDDQFPGVIDSDRLKQIHDAYIEFREWTKCDSIWLNVDDEDLDREIKDVMIMLDLERDPEDHETTEFNEEQYDGSVGYPDPDKDWSDVIWNDEEDSE